jgi:GNAT superfamily N-acetyltransferase
MDTPNMNVTFTYLATTTPPAEKPSEAGVLRCTPDASVPLKEQAAADPAPGVAICELYDQLVRAYAWPDRDHWPAARWFTYLQDPRVTWFLVPGVGLLELAGQQITVFGVLPEAQGHGFGRQLLELALWHGCREGRAIWVATTSDDSPRALRCYTAAGMQIVQRTTVDRETVMKKLKES